MTCVQGPAALHQDAIWLWACRNDRIKMTGCPTRQPGAPLMAARSQASSGLVPASFYWRDTVKKTLQLVLSMQLVRSQVSWEVRNFREGWSWGSDVLHQNHEGGVVPFLLRELVAMHTEECFCCTLARVPSLSSADTPNSPFSLQFPTQVPFVLPQTCCHGGTLGLLDLLDASGITLGCR